MQGENERQWKKSERKKRVTKKFLEVSRCSRAKKRQRNVQKSVLHVQSCFFANYYIRPIVGGAIKFISKNFRFPFSAKKSLILGVKCDKLNFRKT